MTSKELFLKNYQQLTSYTEKFVHNLFQNLLHFLHIRYENSIYSPSPKIDHIWHYLMLCPKLYHEICHEICGSNIVIDHNPFFIDDFQQKIRYNNTLTEMKKHHILNRKIWPIISKNKLITIKLKTLTNKVIICKILKNSTVLHLKQHYMITDGPPECEQRIIYKGLQLEDDLVLTKDCEMFVILRLRGC